MTNENIRQEMEHLWKDTFHDSDDYIRLVFDAYFNPSFIAYHEDKQRIDSALLGVPYEFLSDPSRPPLRGLYLCGLATTPARRDKGLMSALIEKINEIASAHDFDFTFLIPASPSTAGYYARRGYHNAFYKVYQNYVRNHSFEVEKGLENLKFQRLERRDSDLIDFLASHENLSNFRIDSPFAFDFSLLHSRLDWERVVDETFISDLPVFCLYEGDEIKGVAFGFAKGKDLEVKRMILADDRYGNVLLKNIRESMADGTLIVVRDLAVCDYTEMVWSRFYAQNNPASGQYEDIAEVQIPVGADVLAKPYGMIRFFNLHSLLSKLGVEWSEQYEGYDKNELSSLLLRKPVSGKDPLGKMLGVAQLQFSASLLLD